MSLRFFLTACVHAQLLRREAEEFGRAAAGMRQLQAGHPQYRAAYQRAKAQADQALVDLIHHYGQCHCGALDGLPTLAPRTARQTVHRKVTEV